MAVPIVKIHYTGQVYSPFSGEPADGETGPNETDASVLFVYYGNAGEFAYVSDRMKTLTDLDREQLDIEALHGAITINGGVIMEVDNDWNGVNHYGFAP